MDTGSHTTLLTKMIDRARTTSHNALVQLLPVQRALTATEGAHGRCGHGISSRDFSLDDMRVVLLSQVSNGRGGQASHRNSKNL